MEKIVALGVKAILKYRTEAGVMHLMSGDLDMKPLIEEALFNKWKVVLWTWKENLNSEFKNGPLSSSIQINYLDDIESEFVFFYNKEDSKKENIDERKKRKSREQTENNIAIAIIGGGLAGLAALATFVLKKISK